MYRFTLLLMLSFSSFYISANELNVRASDGAIATHQGSITRHQNNYRDSLIELTTLGVPSVIGIDLSYNMDESPTFRLPSIYWVQTHNEDLVRLNETEITTIPIALNNILENVSEHGWDKHIDVSDEEYQAWKKEKGNFAFQYVDTDFKGDRHFKQIDPILYMKAERIYTQAIADVKSLKNANKDTDAISSSLEKYFKSNVELSMIYKLQALTATQPRRVPASIGEQLHTNIPIRLKTKE